ncbi:MAG: hypothetical protein KDA51_18485 [Planctomycetales bacterium]|nr:hypothetical protein [Planctomycetales bacterium]
MSWLEKYRPVTFDALWQQDAPGLRLLKTAVAQRRVANLLIVVAAYGVGKTTLARLLGARINCWNAGQHPYNPCGLCKGCREVASRSEGGTNARDGYLEYDVTAHSPSHIVNSINEHVIFNKLNQPSTGQVSSKWVVCLDEIARVPNKVQENLIKVVENSRRAIFIMCFSDASTVIAPIRERGILIHLPLPTVQQASAALMRIASNEGCTIEESVARHIVELVRRVPRRCVLALEQAAIMSPSKVIEIEAADAAVSLVAS